ncbi:MAG: tetratricopeptide repeat protein, partial [Bryobacteraceae bacterium]
MRLFFISLVSALVIAGVASSQQDTATAEWHNQVGVVHLKKNQFIEAAAEFRKAVEIDPAFIRAWTNLGSSLAQAGDMEESVDAFRKAVALDGKDPQLRMNLGIALRAKGDADLALKEFRAVLKSRPDDVEVHQHLALTMKQLGDLEGAIVGFETVLGLNPEHREAYYNLGTVLRQQAAARRRGRPPARLEPSIEEGLRAAKDFISRGDLKGAHTTLERLAQDTPASADVLNLLGFVQGQERDLPSSVATLTRAVELNSDMPEARYNLGVALWYSGKHAEALESLRHSIRLNPSAAEVYAFLGMALKDKQALQRAIALNPNLPAPYIDLSLVFLRSGQTDMAVGQLEAALNLPAPSAPIPDLNAVVSELRRALSAKPGLPEGHNVLGLLLGKQGADPKQVMAEFREALRLRPDYAEAHNNLGLVLIQVGDSEKAVAAFREALRHAPAYAGALGNLGAALVASRPDEAIHLLEKAVAIQPVFVRAHYNLALAYAQSPEHADKAIPQFRKVIDLEPGFAAAHFEFGKVLFRKNQLTEAIVQFREAV